MYPDGKNCPRVHQRETQAHSGIIGGVLKPAGLIPADIKNVKSLTSPPWTACLPLSIYLLVLFVINLPLCQHKSRVHTCTAKCIVRAITKPTLKSPPTSQFSRCRF